MMNDLQIFKKEEFGEVRVIEKNGEPWFVAKDICDSLGLGDTNKALIGLDDDEKGEHEQYSGSGRKPLLINESGLYSLILRSRKPEAKAFKKWVTSEVLPSIRKTGGYIAARPEDTPDEIMARAVLVANETMIRQRARIESLEIENKVMIPKALFADAVSSSETSILVGEMAKLLRQNGIQTGQNRFFQWLRDNGYLIRRYGVDFNMPTQKSMELEIFEIKERTVVDGNGCPRITKTPKINGKGQSYFINLFLGDPPEKLSA